MNHETGQMACESLRRPAPLQVVARKAARSEHPGSCALRQRLGNQGIQRLVGEVTGKPIQAKLAVSQPGDAHEQEADRVADAVMRTPATPVHRKCADCEQEKKEETTQVQRSSGSAIPLDRKTRDFMEPRFGQSFAHVRVHTGEQAARSAESIDAAAYTVGSDVVFGANRYAPHTSDGRKLIAHELTHVVQQGGDASRISRTANPTTFNCPANTNGAPASPFGDIDTVDRNAQGLAEATSIFAVLSTILDPTTGTGSFDTAYRDRFGPPTQVGTRFQNRFTGRLHATAREAAQLEVGVIGDRLDRIRTFLAGAIRYTCRPTGVNFNHSNCTSRCSANDVMYTCAPNDLRRIEVCPAFWSLASDQQAIGIIHEAGHMLFNFTAHGSGSPGQRARNPECYASLVADSFGITPFDGRCPVI